MPPGKLTRPTVRLGPARALAILALLLAACLALAQGRAGVGAGADLLSGHWRLVRPPGPGPHPAAILLSGCDGVRDNMDFWAEALAARGRAALILDSHGPRGLDRDPAWRPVCAGLALRGPRRAGDLAVALDALAGMEGIDATDVVLLGASHGGWTAMEFVGLASAGAPPPGLRAWPAPPGELLGRVSALVLLYPYCGAFNGATADRWTGAPPTLMILAEKDRIVSTPGCLSRAAALREGGATVRAEVIAGADHAFDQREKSAFSILEFDAARRAEARDLALAFLDGLEPAPSR